MADAIFQIYWFRFKCQTIYKIFTTCKAKISPKIENALNLLKFGAFDILNILISILMSKIIFIKYFYQISIFHQISINSEYFSFSEQFGPSNWQIFDKKSFLTSKSRSGYSKDQMCQISINPGHFQFED